MWRWAVLGASITVCLVSCRRLIRSVSRSSQIIIADRATVQQKLRKIIAGGPLKLQVISDYDKTLTTPNSHTSWDMLERGGLLTENYEKATNELVKKYHPIEIDISKTNEEKLPAMSEWWNQATALLVAEKLSRPQLIAGVKPLVQKVELRLGYEEFFAMLARVNVPVLILSAGIGDMIEFAFASKGLDKYNHKNVHVLSNFFQFDETTALVTGFKGKMIHVCNKNEVVVRETPHYANIAARGNVILLGDSLGDIYMADGVPHECVLSIGFLNLKDNENPTKAAALLEQYKKCFDVVLVRDNSLAYINDLLKDICGRA